MTARRILYLEGSDQHRGWFHSSLLCSVGTRGEAPYRNVLTHGFVVDGKGKAMHKSAGNVIAPEKLIKQYGAEIVRMWVAGEDYRDNIRLSKEILQRLTEAYRRIRNTCRYLLGNLSDFDAETDSVSYEEMEELDRWALHQLQELSERIQKAYEDFQFSPCISQPPQLLCPGSFCLLSRYYKGQALYVARKITRQDVLHRLP